MPSNRRLSGPDRQSLSVDRDRLERAALAIYPLVEFRIERRPDIPGFDESAEVSALRAKESVRRAEALLRAVDEAAGRSPSEPDDDQSSVACPEPPSGELSPDEGPVWMTINAEAALVCCPEVRTLVEAVSVMGRANVTPEAWCALKPFMDVRDV